MLTIEKKKSVCIENLPVPAVETDAQFSFFLRNRLAEKLLPAPWKLKRLLAAKRGEKKENALFVLEAEGVPYTVLRFFSETEVFVFLENMTALHLPFARFLMEESATVMEDFERAGRLLGEKSDPEEWRALSERIVNRSFELRRGMTLYRRLLGSCERKRQEACCLSIVGLLSLISEKLKAHRVDLALSGTESKRLAAYLSADALASVVLNLVQFVLVYEGVRSLRASVEPKGREILVEFSFHDREGIFSILASLLEGEICEGTEWFSPGLLPLLQSFLACMENKLRIRLRTENATGVVSLFLRSANQMPEAFLGTDDRKENALVSEWIQEILF